MKKLWIVLMLSALVSCGQDQDKSGEDEVSESIDAPIGSVNAIPVYNHAYNENYDSDQIDDILLNANNAYVLIDPFQDGVSDTVWDIKAKGNQVGAYISVGTGENWRDDFIELEPYLVTQQWDEWPGEFFINETTTGVVDVMKARIDKIADWGFDWVEFDNMDWALYQDVRETYGLQVTKEQGVAYFQELCDYVQQSGMKCMAKNFVEDANDFDGVTYESYSIEKNWWDESGAQSFLNAGKVVIIVHYNETDCNGVYSDYIEIYNDDLSFICEDANLEKYVHYNEP